MFVLFVHAPSVFAGQVKCDYFVFDSYRYSGEMYVKGEVCIEKLVPKNESPYVNGFDRLPTLVLYGSHRGEIEKILKADGSSTPFNSLLTLPEPDQILSIDSSPQSARRKVKLRNWKILEMKTVTYRNPQGSEGAMLVCMTLQQEIGAQEVQISQCNSFYPEDMRKLREIAGKIETLHQRTIEP